jgi:chemotaxis protein MotB
MSRKKKHHAEHHEEHTDESWLVPYADILTLLLALFIVLFASADANKTKFTQMAQSLSAAFSGSPSVFDNNTAISPEINSTKPDQAKDDPSKEQAQLRETVQLLEVKKEIDKYINKNNLVGDLNTALTEDGLMIRIKDSALFPSGSAEIRPESQRFGAEIAKMLATLQQQIVVSGHTDNIPINTREFPSNWELSSKRAINFMKLLLVQEKLKPERFSAIGYGEYRAINANDSEEGRGKNRRVEVLIMRNYKM